MKATNVSDTLPVIQVIPQNTKIHTYSSPSISFIKDFPSQKRCQPCHFHHTAVTTYACFSPNFAKITEHLKGDLLVILNGHQRTCGPMTPI